MADSIRARISGAIVSFLEPQIQGLITDRILLFRRKLMQDGLVLDSWADSKRPSNRPSPIADVPCPNPDQHG